MNMVGFCRICKVLCITFLFLWVPMGMGYSCWEDEEKGENYVAPRDLMYRYPYFYLYRDEIPAGIMVQDTTVIPCNVRQFLFRLRPPYELWDYSWRCCFMDLPEWVYVEALNRNKARLRTFQRE